MEPVAKPPSLNDSWSSNDLHPLAVYKIKSAGKTGTELPPGTNAFKVCLNSFRLNIHQNS
jgi:hypothetical protein